MNEKDIAELEARIARLEWALDYVGKHLGLQIPEPPLAGGVSQNVLALVRQGNRIGAIQAHMAETGVDMATARTVVGALE